LLYFAPRDPANTTLLCHANAALSLTPPYPAVALPCVAAQFRAYAFPCLTLHSLYIASLHRYTLAAALPYAAAQFHAPAVQYCAAPNAALLRHCMAMPRQTQPKPCQTTQYSAVPTLYQC